MKFLISWIIILSSLVVAVLIVPGIYIEGTNAWIAFGAMALILGLVNVFIKPILNFLSCGCIALTLGLFMLVINAFVLWFSAYLANLLGIGFVVDGFLPAFLGGLIVSVVSFLLSMLFLND